MMEGKDSISDRKAIYYTIVSFFWMRGDRKQEGGKGSKSNLNIAYQIAFYYYARYHKTNTEGRHQGKETRDCLAWVSQNMNRSEDNKNYV